MKTAFIIRHSKRDSIANPLEHAKVGLNEEGKILTTELGKRLAKEFKSVKVYSSPVGRCIQTGECIQKAFSDDSRPTESTMLGEPGPFVFGDAIESFVKLGTTGVVEAIENGKTLLLIRSEEEGTKLLLDFVREKTLAENEGTAVVFVTHDACIAPVIHFFTGEFFNENHWIEFLGGLKIQFESDFLNVQRFKGEK